MAKELLVDTRMCCFSYLEIVGVRIVEVIGYC